MTEETLKQYVGVKLVEARPEEKDGQPGYRVLYPDGYSSWSPAEPFEKHYFELDQEYASIDREYCTEQEVSRMVHGYNATGALGSATAHVWGLNGFAEVGDPIPIPPIEGGASEAGKESLRLARYRLGRHLDFVLAWASRGLDALKQSAPTPESNERKH